MSAFGDAFKAARAAGKTTFKFNGKSYHTKTKEEMERIKKAVPVPTPRPDTAAAKRAPAAQAKTTATGGSTPGSTSAPMFRQALEATTGSRSTFSLTIPTKSDQPSTKDAAAPVKRPAVGGKSAAMVNRKVEPWQYMSKPRRTRAWANK